jgi:hypothetical protein
MTGDAIRSVGSRFCLNGRQTGSNPIISGLARHLPLPHETIYTDLPQASSDGPNQWPSTATPR